MFINEKNATRYTLYVMLLSFIGRFAIGKWTGLGIGESYYYGGARILSLSYFDQPPFFMWVSGILMRVFGETSLVLRLPALVSFFGTSWIIFLITKKLFNKVAGFYAVLFISISGVFVLAGTWFQPDAFLMFFWVCYVYCLIQIIFLHKEEVKANLKTIYYWFVLSGIALGLTILSKYHAIFLVIGLFLFISTNKNYRHWLIHPGLYLSIFISLLFAIPIFIWNYEHHFASFLFQGSRALDGGNFKIHFDWFFRSILGQSLWLLPWIWVPLIMELIKSFKLRQVNSTYAFCFWLAITPIVFFTIITLWADLQYHFHWQAPGYMMLFIPLGKMIQEKLEGESKYRLIIKRWIIGSVAFTVIAFSFLAIHMQTGFWTWYGPKWIAMHTGGGAYDATMDGYDYTDLKDVFSNNGWLKDPNLFVGTTKWWMSGKVDWALKGNKDIICFNQDARNYIYFSNEKNLIGKNAIVITKGEDPAIKNVIPYCDSLKQIQGVEIKRSGVSELTLNLYYCKNFHNIENLPYTK